MQSEKTFKDTARDIYSSVVGAYVLITLCVFPVFVTDMYFDILVDKYYFYLVSTISMAAVLLILTGIFAFIDKRENGGENIRQAIRCFKPASLKESLTLCDMCIIIFFIVSALATFFSEWFYEAFWGNMGRYSGFFLWIWYVVMYFIVTRFFKFKKWYLDAFILVGLYVCIWGIQDYFQLDPHGYLVDVDPIDRDIFTSSIGNINTYTAWVAIYMAVSSVMFITEGNALFSGYKDARELYASGKKGTSCAAVSGGVGAPYGYGTESESLLSKALPARARIIISNIRVLFYLASTCVFFTALIMGQSDNAVLSLGALIAFLPFLAWKNREGFIRYLIVLTAFCVSMWFTGWVSTKYADMVLPPDNGSMLISLSYKPVWRTACIALIAAAIALTAIIAVGAVRSKCEGGYRNAANKALPNLIRYIWLALGILAVAVIGWMFWDANHGGHPEWYAPYRNIMYFDQNWGTHRGHNWGLLMGHFSEFPLWKKLIGSGPETYGIVTRIYDYYEMKNAYGEIYDSAHNEYLQYLFTTGIIGLVSYLGWLSFGVADTLRKVKRAPWAKACAFAVIAYGAQAVVNITVPIVVPAFLLMLSMGVAEARKESGI